MKLFQLSAGQGPSECCLTVAHAWRQFNAECSKAGFVVKLLELEKGRQSSTYRSVLMTISETRSDAISSAVISTTTSSTKTSTKLDEFLKQWTGTMQWICKSPFRSKHGRKNWFFSGKIWSVHQQSDMKLKDFKVRTCRAGGPGGQHLNTTDSAVQIHHLPSGLSVKVQTERSQHQNKRLAWILIQHKLRQQNETELANVKGRLRMQHHQLERGDAVRIFYGANFKCSQ